MRPINLSDLSESPYISSGDYEVGTVLPALTIRDITVDEVPIEGSNKKNTKGVMWFEGAKRGWVMNKTEMRKIGSALQSKKDIANSWKGAKVQLHVVGDVRRPNGTKGNAFRVKEVWPATDQG